MTRCVVIAGGAHEAEFEVIGRAILALDEALEIDSARAMTRDGTPLRGGGMRGLHDAGISAGPATASSDLGLAPGGYGPDFQQMAIEVAKEERASTGDCADLHVIRRPRLAAV